MPGSDTYFLEFSDVVLLKVETKGVIVLKLYFKYYYSSIVSFTIEILIQRNGIFLKCLLSLFLVS